MIVYQEKTAVISDCQKYRYLLRRSWDHIKPRFLIVMLNPSTADADKDDATIRSCTRLCAALGAGSYEVVNLMAWRATNPKDLPDKPSLAMGSDNPRVIEAAINRCDIVICAWGAHPYAARFKGAVLDMISLYRPASYCFGKNKDGSPKHPLYIKSEQQLEMYA